MNEIDSAVAEVLESAYSCLSREDAEKTTYDLHTKSLTVVPSQEAGYDLISAFNAYCESHGRIEYFAFASTLVGAITYKGFMPGSSDIEIGMTRADFFRLEKALRADPSDEFILDAYLDYEKTAYLRMPIVRLRYPDFIGEDGHLVYGNDNLPLQANPKLRISIFDGIPDDYDVSRAFYFELKTLNRRYDTSRPEKQLRLSRAIWKLADSYNKGPRLALGRLFPSRSKTIKIDELYPLRKIPFGPTEIMCPCVTTPWVIEDSDRELEQVQCLQKDALKIAAEIDRICRANDIGYFICGGTMLGYVRHGGFIPWDDDIDVGMLRADYEKFLKIAPSQLGPEFFLQTRESDPNIPYLFSKVRLRGTEYITAYNEFRDFDKGICVDVFPFDKAPVGDWRMVEFRKKVDALIRNHNSTVNRQVPKEGLDSRRAANPIEFLEQAVMRARHRKYWDKSLMDTQRAYDETVTLFNGDDSMRFVASYVATFTCVHLDDLLPYRDVDFEGITLKVPNHPEVFLQMQYGNFMAIPMPHQQRGHGLLRWKGTEKSSDDFS